VPRLAALLLVLTLGACAHADADAPTATPEVCAEARVRYEREVAHFEDAKRACANYSPETVDHRDCMVARGVRPGAPPRLEVEDGPPCRP
jgi:hypothetical protein